MYTVCDKKKKLFELDIENNSQFTSPMLKSKSNLKWYMVMKKL